MTIKDKNKIKELIRNCKVFRYSTEESLEYLKENGHEISDRTLRRLKKEMISDIPERFLEIMKTEYSDELLRSFDALKKIEKKYWDEDQILKQTKLSDKLRGEQQLARDEYLPEGRHHVLQKDDYDPLR